MGKGESAPAGEGGRFARRMSAAGIAVIFAGVMALSVWRAATQSVVHDEALTYNWFAGRPLIQMFNYDANHHIHTWLVRASVSAFGVWSSRCVFRRSRARRSISRPWRGSSSANASGGPVGPAAFALGAGNPSRSSTSSPAPAATDSPSIPDAGARVHGPAPFRRFLAAGPRLAGLALGGSVATNLAFAFPSSRTK